MRLLRFRRCRQPSRGFRGGSAAIGHAAPPSAIFWKTHSAFCSEGLTGCPVYRSIHLHASDDDSKGPPTMLPACAAAHLPSAVLVAVKLMLHLMVSEIGAESGDQHTELGVRHH